MSLIMLSGVVLTHNSENTLSKTLNSLEFCDEIIVIDDDSTDNTIKIAREHRATVYKRSLHDDFAEQRNYGLEKARGEWVLFVDSDEIVSSALAREIKFATSASKTTVSGYYISRQDYFGGRGLKFGETRHVRLLRLSKKNAGIWKNPVHEIWQIQGKTEKLVNPLEHFPHNDVAQFLDKINRYSSIRAKYLLSQGKRSSLWQIVAYPTVKFFVNYIGKLGFLDGMEGMIMAMMMSFHSFLVRAKLWTLNRQIKE